MAENGNWAGSARIRECSTRDDYIAWDRFVYNFPGAHYFQTYGWLKSCEPLGFNSHVLVFENNNVICGGVAFLTSKIPFLPWQIFIIPHGPIPATPDAPSWLPLMERLDDMCHRGGAIFAQLYPHESKQEMVLLPRLERLGFKHPPMFKSRFSSIPVTIDLVGKTEWDVLMSLRPETRRHIRRSLESRLVLGTEVDGETFKRIYELFLENSKLHGYRPRPYESYRLAWEWFAPLGLATFIQAWCDETLVGAMLLIFAGRTAYFMQSSVRRGFNEYFPGEFIYWHSIREALTRNLDTCDLINFWPASVKEFKEGFRPRVGRWHGPRTKLYRPMLARFASVADSRLRPLLGRLARLRVR
jgi:lipid II:glycine glycyltransferase (peptidoglycan interpeptide bridge formation enzyme)